jgi:hypothetical protein
VGRRGRRHELSTASRFESAVREAQPPVDRLSERLTALLGQALTVEALTIPPGLGLRLEPESLVVSERGYEVGWRVVLR